MLLCLFLSPGTSELNIGVSVLEIACKGKAEEGSASETVYHGLSSPKRAKDA